MEIYEDIKNLFCMCRSITGKSVVDTLNYIKNKIPINILTVKSGTKCYDWQIPREWNIKDAYIKKSNGDLVVNIKDNYLHILNYSSPINKIVKLEELKKHIFTLEDFPEWIPYYTSYYKENWGFCMKHNDFINLIEDDYEVFIDSTFDENGNMNYGEIIVPGKSEKEILLSSYICHPQQCNDSLSGVAVLMHLTKYLLQKNNYFTYRIIFIPETIGSIYYLSKHIETLKKNVVGGYVLTCLGDEGEFTYLKTRNENQFIDRVTLNLLEEYQKNYKIREFNTCGSDERQYNYPGIDLNIGSLMKTKYGEFDEYHTSADNLEFISPKGLEESYNMYIKCLDFIEINMKYKNNTICEPFMTKYNLYSSLGGSKISNCMFYDILKILYYVDEKNDIIDISKKLNLKINYTTELIKILLDNNLISLT